MINHFVEIQKDLQFMVSLNILSIVTIKLFWFVAVLVCGRFGVWPFWFVAVLVCGRYGCGRVWPFCVAVLVVAVLVCGRFDLHAFITMDK